MRKFDLVFEEYMYSLTDGNIDSNNIKKEYRSLEEFKLFCKSLELFVELVKDADQIDNRKFIGANLYFINNNDKEMNTQFDYYLKNNKKYFTDNEDIFNALNNYKLKYIVTLNGKKDDPIILWG